MSQLLHLTSREQYEHILETIVEEHPTAVADDPFHVAASMVVNVEPVATETGLTRTYGTTVFDNRVLYPTDVIAYSKQPVAQIRRQSESTPGDVTEDLVMYAVYTLQADLEDTLPDCCR